MELTLPGLSAPVEVIYDGFGVPHIYAETTADLFLAQGYVEASHRFWQMDWWRHLSAGRLSEIAGEPTVGNDFFLRTMQYEAAADRDLEIMSDEGRAVLDAYTAGVNAYLDGKTPAEVALEYQTFATAGVDLEIAPWTPNDTVRWFKVMSQDLSGNFQGELYRAGIVDAVGEIPARFLLPEYDYEQFPVITEPGGVDYAGASEEMSLVVPEGVDYSRVSFDLVGDVKLDDPLLRPFGSGMGIGSNSWAIGGEMTASGMPYLANDPHLGIQMPSIWYEVGLHCIEVTEACPYNVVGVSFAGAPGVIIGHNDNIGWGFTNVGTDVQDLYVLTLNPDNPGQYMLDGEWTDFEIITEEIEVQGGTSRALTIRNSVWGPVISDVIGYEDQVFALRWTAFDANTQLDALLQFNRARNWDEFRQAASLFDVPAQNLLYVDVEGNIAYQMPGKTPIRADGHSGLMPVDGSTTDNAWQGFVPFEELPMVLNPEAGYIVTANNPVVGPDYPYYITDGWDRGYRAARIEMMIQNDPDGVITIEDIQAMHLDNYNMKADFLVPALQNLTFEDETLTDLVSWLADWDRQNDPDSGEAALFEMFWVMLLENVFVDDLGLMPSGGSSDWYLVSLMLENPNNAVYGLLWDDANTDGRETAEDMLRLSFSQAVDEMQVLHGEDPAAWSWGALHIASFRAAPLGQGGIDPTFDPLLDSLYNVHISVGGGSSIVNATGWSAANPFSVGAVPSMRQILTPEDWDMSLRINTVGQSGNPQSRHYEDQVEMWAQGEYHPDWFSREAVEADAEATWMLMPAE
ncbi:MAG: penicillin acylase family protein [Chloroflexi bacterium]|nr:penicillin acylase family protein [Chloroflexota bacterium]